MDPVVSAAETALPTAPPAAGCVISNATDATDHSEEKRTDEEDEDELDGEDQEDEEDEEEDDVSLGFVVDESEPRALLRNHFPSKLGGLPAWLDPVQLPLESELRCKASGEPLRFLLQVYAPINDDARAFHRAVFVFISPRGSSLGEPGAIRAFRCQLPRANDYYPYEPPLPEDQPTPLADAAVAVAAHRCARLASSTSSESQVGRPHSVASTPPFREHELEVEPEPSAAEAATQDPQVNRLLAAYKEKMQVEAKAGAPAADEPDVSAFGAPNQELTDFTAFTARVSRAPDQVLRYTYADDTQPLWASRRRRPPAGAVPPCARCGGRRRFEFQVMPQALSFLGIDSMDEEAPDWATLAVYTCARSCPPTPPLADGGGDLADPPTAESAEALAAVGHTARLQGLKSRPELNGTTCIVLNWIPDAARWAVQCEGSGERLKARSANVQLKPTWPPGAPVEREGGYAEEYVWVQTDKA